MDFRIADTLTGGMARLTNDEQKLVKTTALDLQLNPTNPPVPNLPVSQPAASIAMAC